jgi:hypothetical protein
MLCEDKALMSELPVIEGLKAQARMFMFMKRYITFARFALIVSDLVGTALPVKLLSNINIGLQQSDINITFIHSQDTKCFPNQAQTLSLVDKRTRELTAAIKNSINDIMTNMAQRKLQA